MQPVNDLLGTIAQVTEEWKALNTPEAVKKKVFKQLDAVSDEVVMKLLGFDCRWDKKWEIDHCNGRAGESAAGDFIREAHNEAIKEWLGQVIMPQLTPALKKKLQKMAQDEYENYITRHIRSAVTARAEMDLKQFIQDLAETPSLEGFVKLRSLIAPNQTKEAA